MNTFSKNFSTKMKYSIKLKQIKKHWALLTILAVAVILRFYQLDFQSPWLDELHTLIETNPELSYKEFYNLMLYREQMPHLYYILVRISNVIFGETLFGNTGIFCYYWDDFCLCHISFRKGVILQKSGIHCCNILSD